ncbi:MAG: hypothetical protein HY718_17060 [Planctomycetes bacterium]|nr:hypothetical protein [Planctomycetota bacterium]
MITSLPETAVCLRCGYLLRGLPRNVCPECGKPFDPQDALTWANPPVGWTAKRVARVLKVRERAQAPGRKERVLTILATVAVLVKIAVSPFGFPSTIIVGLFAISVFVACGLDYAACLMAIGGLKKRRIDRLPGARRRGWRTLPVCAALVGAALVYPWPLAVRFAVSYPALSRAASQARAGTLPRNIG